MEKSEGLEKILKEVDGGEFKMLVEAAGKARPPGFDQTGILSDTLNYSIKDQQATLFEGETIIGTASVNEIIEYFNYLFTSALGTR